MLSIFEFWVLLFVYRQYVTCMKRLTSKHGRYAGEVTDTVITRLAVVS